MLSLNFLSRSPAQTKKLARLLLSQSLPSGPVVFALTGPLGAGKTNFVQGLAKALGIKERITSPSFVILKSFLIPQTNRLVKSLKRFLWHIDCWRVDESALRKLGLEEILADPQNIVCLEWAEKLRGVLPPGALWVKLEPESKNHRRILISSAIGK